MSADTGRQTMQPTLGIIAGGGGMPGRVATAARAAGRAVFIVGLEGFAERPVLAPFPHTFARIGAVGAIRQLLDTNGCRDLVLIGSVRRPSFLDMRPDAEGAKLIARIGRAAFAGDDGLLGAIVRILEQDGYKVLAAQDILREALAPSGLLTTAAPDAQAMADIARGVVVARALGVADVGQGCVVQQGLVLAVEAVEGTDGMISRCAPLARPGPGGVLVKLAKPGQERRADLPTIGPSTVQAAHTAGLRGIAFEAGGTLIADRDATVALADKTGLFLLGIDPGTYTSGERP